MLPQEAAVGGFELHVVMASRPDDGLYKRLRGESEAGPTEVERVPLVEYGTFRIIMTQPVAVSSNHTTSFNFF